MKKAAYRLFITLVALLIAASGYAQRYPCFDYTLIENGFYECKFDLEIGELTFKDGIIRPEKELTDKEINDAIDAGLLKYMQTLPGNERVNTTLQNPCLVMTPYNNAVRNMYNVLGEDNTAALYNNYENGILDCGGKLAQELMPDFGKYMKIISTAAKDGATPAMIDLSGQVSGVGNFGLDMFVCLNDWLRKHEQIKRRLRENEAIVEKGAQAETALSSIYAYIYEEIKKKMKDTQWVMKMGAVDRQTKDRVFWKIPVKVDYVLESANLKKVALSEDYRGMYRGDIVIRIENMQGLDEALPLLKETSNIVNPIDAIYKRLPFRESSSYDLVVNSPTRYTRRVRFQNITIDVRQGKYTFSLSGRQPEEPEFSFNSTLKAAVTINMSKSGALIKGFFRDEMDIKTTNPLQVNASSAYSRFNWFLRAPMFYYQNTGDGITEGYSYQVPMPRNTFLQALTGEGSIIVYPNSEAERKRNYQSARR